MNAMSDTTRPGAPKSSTDNVPFLRRRLVVRGRVQGVGFRPFIYRLARRWELGGLVGNDSHGAFIEIEGPAAAVREFIDSLKGELPPLARISELCVETMAPRGQTRFHIETSMCGGGQDAEIAPDVAVCDDCLSELFDPQDRRHGYPFINCMHCGPRYSIIRAVPYDRANTTMCRFVMCPACQAEYDDPLNRRFHAQPNACPACGPRLWFVDGLGQEIDGHPVRGAAAWLMSGRIVAIKGIGGFHLACRADDGEVVRRLRERKQRDAKAFAVMVPSLEVARELAEVDDLSEEAMASRARPIVLAPKRGRQRISDAVAPHSDYYGLMLPYTPLHHLLFACEIGPLVMTSANPSEEPLCRDNDEAMLRLQGIADAFLVNDRDIERRVDDSVVLAVSRHSCVPLHGEARRASKSSGEGSTHSGRQRLSTDAAVARNPAAPHRVLPVRRARGYAPAPIRVPIESPEPVLAVGGELKSTVCLLAGRQAVLSEHLGELSNAAALRNFMQTIERFKELLGLDPRVVACDSHPDYAATRHARQMGLRTIDIQHHHAHAASCMADNGLTGRVLAISCDGTGYGTDAAIWGCEVLACDEADFTRGAHLDYFPLLGGDAAAQETWRPAVGLLHQAFGESWREAAQSSLRRVDAESLRLAEARLAAGARVPQTSSLGRLFDAVAFLLGVCDQNRYEAEAAMTLEAIARRQPPAGPLPFELHEHEAEPLRLDVRPMIQALLGSLQAGDRPERLARSFHETIAEMLVVAVLRLGQQTGLDRVVLSGGCFANRLLLELMTCGLHAAGLAVFAHERVPTGDGGLALGQAVIAAERLRRNQ